MLTQYNNDMSINYKTEAERINKTNDIIKILESIPTQKEIEEKYGTHHFYETPVGLIYGVHNKMSGRWYIGQTKQTINIKSSTFNRYPNGWIQHNFQKKEVQEDLIKFGFGSFEDIKILSLAYSEDELNDLEGYWIKEKDSIFNGYNSNPPLPTNYRYSNYKNKKHHH